MRLTIRRFGDGHVLAAGARDSLDAPAIHFRNDPCSARVYRRPKRVSMTVEVADTRAVEALLQARADQLVSLSKLSDAVTRTASLDDTYEAALDCVADTLSPDRASVLLFDDGGVLRFKAWRRLSDDYRRSTEGHSPWSAETRDPQPVLVE